MVNCCSRSATMASGCPRKKPNRSLMRSLPPNLKAAVWGYQSAAPLWNRTEGVCGPRRTTGGAQRFISLCRSQPGSYKCPQLERDSMSPGCLAVIGDSAGSLLWITILQPAIYRSGHLRLLVGFFQMATKFIPHCRQELVGKVRLAARTEPLVKRRSENRGWYRFVDRSLNRPASFARVGDATGKFRKIRILQEGRGGQIQQPRGDHTSPTPDLRDVSQIHIVLIVLRIAQWCSFRVGGAVRSYADVRAAQNREPFSVRCHDSVFYSVVDHLDEMSSAVRAAVQIALFGGAVDLFPPTGARSSGDSRGKRSENRIKPLDDLGLASNHHAVSSLQPPHSSAGSDIHIVDLLRGELLCAAEIINIIGVAAVDKHVAGFEMRGKIGDSVIDNCRGDHQPDRSRSLKFLDCISKRRRPNRLFLNQFVHWLWGSVIHNAAVPLANESPGHVASHPSKTDHADFHRYLLRTSAVLSYCTRQAI